MKTIINSLILIVTLVSTTTLSAQTIYNVNSNTTYSAAGIPVNCNNCTINIANGVTLTIDKNVNLQNVSFNGGATTKSTIIANNHDIVFSAPGSFTNIIADLKNANLSNSGALTITNSAFSFTTASHAVVNASVSLVSSSWKLFDNSDLAVTSGVFSIRSGNLTIGDGTPASKANADFSGGSLSILDGVSFVSVVTAKNTYKNPSPYNANGTPVATSSTLKGPASLTGGGVVSSATLPVKLSSFTAKSNGSTVMLSWTTVQEIKAEVFDIERSIDGATYTKVGAVAANGNTSLTTHYSYTEVVKGGSSYSYRLKMVDIDNKSEYSPIVKLSFNNTTSGFLKTYPNPATDFFAVDGSGSMQVQVISLGGTVVKVINGYVANDKVSLSGVIAGNYVVRVSGANGSSQCFKMIVAR